MKIEVKFKIGQIVWVETRTTFFVSLPWALDVEMVNKKDYPFLMNKMVEKQKIEVIWITKDSIVYNYYPSMFLHSTGYKETELYLTKKDCIEANYKSFKKKIDQRRRDLKKYENQRVKDHMKEHSKIIKYMSKEGKENGRKIKIKPRTHRINDSRKI